MFSLNLWQIADAMSAKIINKGDQTEFSSVCTDSREIKRGALFFALCGERFDGHNFINKAIGSGASGVVLERKVELTLPGVSVLMVGDTVTALQDLAKYNRLLSGIPVVGVTGSSGKTSTKDLIYEVLSVRYSTLKTEGNYNNELGLPLTLINLDKIYQAAVVEMAMRGPGEIDSLSRIAQPTGAVITNIGTAHFEKLGSVDNIAKAKGEILDYIPHNGFAVLNGDSPYLYREALRCRGRVMFYGEDSKYDFYPRKITPEDGGNRFTAVIMGKEEEFFVPLSGRHNVINSLAAIAVGLEFGLKVEEIRAGLSAASLSAMRLEILELNGVKILNDSYNANPESTRAAIQALAEAAGKDSRKIAVLGDMLELGEKSEWGHRKVGSAAYDAGVHLLAVVGEKAEFIGKGAQEAGMSPGQIFYFQTAREAASLLKENIKTGDVVLVKGSRGMKMEDFVCKLQEGT